MDTHPAIPLGPSQEGRKPEYEDYYPKSLTGLGGLSLSSAGSSRSFRQDLNQVFVPLIVDPQSFTSTVKSSIQVPDDVFPTISIVPGQMISFKYYVEVVVDLRGKRSSQDRVRSQFDMVNGATGQGSGDPQVSNIDRSSGLVSPLASGFGCLDTSQIRRERSVVWWPFEVIVGTRDSERRRGKQIEDSSPLNPSRETAIFNSQRMLATEHTLERSQSSQGLAPHYHEANDYFNAPLDPYDSTRYTNIPQATLPPETDEAIDEKSQIRQAEERLLPSAPPVIVGPWTCRGFS